jgi:WD40 repeat protein
VRFRCVSNVNNLAISPNGKWLAVSSLLGDHFTLFDAVTGRPLPHVQGEWRVTAAAFSADSRWLATAGDDVVKVWDTSTFARVATFSRPTLREKELASVAGLAFSPDGRTLVTGHTDWALTRWDWQAGKALGQLIGHRGWVSRLAFFPDGKRLVSGSWDGTTRIWDVATGKVLRMVAEEFITLSPDGNLLVTSPNRSEIGDKEFLSGSATLHLQAPLGGGPVRTIQVRGFFVLTGAVSRDGSTLAVNSSSEKGAVQVKDLHLFDLRTGKLQRTLPDNVNGAWPVRFSEDGNLVLTGSRETYGNAVRFWDRRTGKRVRCYPGHENAVRAAAYLRGSNLVATAGTDGVVRLWDADSGREKGALASPGSELWSMAVSPDGRRLACEASGYSVYVWQVPGAEPPLQIRLKAHPQRVAFTPDGRWLTVGTTDGELLLYDPVTGKAGRRLVKLAKEPMVLAYAPDGKTVAWGGYENDIRLIDRPSGKQRQQLKGHTFWLRALAFSPEGRWLASGSDDGSARLWDLKAGVSHVLFQDPEEHQLHSVSAVAFSPDGALLATGHWDGRIRLWEGISRQRIADLPGHRAAVTSLDSAPDGRRFVSGSDDTTGLVWDLPGLFGPTRVPPARHDRDRLWSDLASRDALQGQRAVWELQAGGDAAVTLLDGRLRELLWPPGGKASDRDRALVAGLDSPTFTVRERAQRELKKQGFRILPQLRRRLGQRPPLDAQRRLEKLIWAIERQTEQQRWRLRRVVQALELQGTPPARSLVERLAGEGHEAEMMQAALRRLGAPAPRR